MKEKKPQLAEIKTKVPPILAKRFRELMESVGSTVYEYVQNCVFLRLKYDMHQHYCEQADSERLFDLLSPILELDNQTEYARGFMANASNELKRNNNIAEVEKVIVIRKGGATCEYTKQDETWTKCFETDHCALDLLTAGRSAMRKDIKTSMDAMGFKSFGLFIRKLVQDIAPDVETLIRNKNSSGLTMTYGVVPVRHPNKAGSNGHRIKDASRNPGNDYGFAFEDEPEFSSSIDTEIEDMFADMAEGGEDDFGTEDDF